MWRVRAGHGGRDPAAQSMPRPPGVVAEGLTIAAAAVRLTVKNRILVDALAEGADFDEDRFIPVARSAMLAMAVEAQAEADRVEHERRRARRRISPSGGTHDYRYRDVDNLALRRRHAQRVADGLRRRAGDEKALRQIVEASRQAAWAEVSRAIDMTLRMESAPPDLGGDYAASRADRIHQFVTIDLANLAALRHPGMPTG